MSKSSLCDYSNAYIFVKRTITIENKAIAVAANSPINKQVISKNCVPFSKCIKGVNNTQVDDTHFVNLVMPMYNLIE